MTRPYFVTVAPLDCLASIHGPFPSWEEAAAALPGLAREYRGYLAGADVTQLGSAATGVIELVQTDAPRREFSTNPHAVLWSASVQQVRPRGEA